MWECNSNDRMPVYREASDIRVYIKRYTCSARIKWSENKWDHKLCCDHFTQN